MSSTGFSGEQPVAARSVWLALAVNRVGKDRSRRANQGAADKCFAIKQVRRATDRRANQTKI